jgi:hypothetical protein
MNETHFVKARAQLSLQITDCSPATHEALLRRSKTEGYASITGWIVDVALGMLESCEESMSAAEIA